MFKTSLTNVIADLQKYLTNLSLKKLFRNHCINLIYRELYCHKYGHVYIQLVARLLFLLLYRHECFTGKYTTRKIHTKPHPGRERRISEDLDAFGDITLVSLNCT